MVTTDYVMLQAANLRVNWADQDIKSFVKQISNVTTVDEARDLIIALAITADKSLDSMRKLLSESF